MDAFYVVGFDKGTGKIRAISHADKDLAYRIAADYHKNGYHGRVLTDAEFEAASDKNNADFGSGYRRQF